MYSESGILSVCVFFGGQGTNSSDSRESAKPGRDGPSPEDEGRPRGEGGIPGKGALPERPRYGGSFQNSPLCISDNDVYVLLKKMHHNEDRQF